MNPKVSVVMPAYNTARYIQQAIDSVLTQTEQNLEVIVVDDASTDNTVEVVKNFSDDRIKLLVNERNRGDGYSRNQALRAATGEWIALLDSDDWYASPIRLERLLEVAKAETADFVADDVYFIHDGEQQPFSTLFSVGEQFDRPKAIDAITVIESNAKPARYSPHYGLTKPLIKRSFLAHNQIEYHETLKVVADLHFYMKCLANGARFMIIPEAYYFYRRTRQGSIVNKSNRLQQLEPLRQLALDLLQQEYVKHNAALSASISKFLTVIEQSLDYHRVIQPIKERGLLAAFNKTLNDSSYRSLFISQIPEIVRRRVLNFLETTKDI
jgi:succinoglycan biosynthesis protein ExoO